MHRFPKLLSPYHARAQQLIDSSAVRDIDFSGSTYQILVYADPESEAWAFLQLDDRGVAKDFFCECDQFDQHGGCIHVATGYLRVTQPEPLHRRFDKSLWTHLCKLYAEKSDYDQNALKWVSKTTCEYCTYSGKLLVKIHATTPEAAEKLMEMTEERRKETEETSLKFSNLSQEELAEYESGKLSPQLSYRLSAWYDIAKWLFLQQDTGASYTIVFDNSAEGIPNTIRVTFPDAELFFFLSEANLGCIIPALATVRSPLVVRDVRDEVLKSLTYDKETGTIQTHLDDKLLVSNERELERRAHGRQTHVVGAWTYLPGDGFYRHGKGSLLSHTSLQGSQISELFRDHFQMVYKRLQDAVLHADPLELSYHLAFDEYWNLQVAAYAFAPGDLQKDFSRDFGDWVYIENDGFYRSLNRRFPTLLTTIQPLDVGDFVTRHQLWLGTVEGFSPHLTAMEALLTYHLDQQQRLIFSNRHQPDNSTARQKDFGRWMYVSGEGFYPKMGGVVRSPVRAGAVIPPPEISSFIRKHHDELEVIPKFFCETCPVARAYLSVELDAKERIHIHPIYEPTKIYAGKEIHFFDDVVYVDGAGFYRVPAEKQLPETYRLPVTIKKNELAEFLNTDIEVLKKYSHEIDPRLQRPHTVNLVMDKIEQRQDLGRGWYSVTMHCHTERGNIPLSTIWEQLQKKKRFLFSSVGLLDLSEEKFHWLSSTPSAQVDEENSGFLLTLLDIARLQAMGQVEATQKRDHQGSEVRHRLHGLLDFKEEAPPDISGLTSTLRPYQVSGVSWLWHLYENGLSGMLCDDMGLGKTHQAMALMAALANRGVTVKILVICPTSVLYHWEEKIHAFLPGWKVFTYHGVERQLTDYETSIEIFLTSYGIWRRDVEKLKKLSFDLVILDEIQVAKNHSSRLHQALREVKSTMRIGLTGTPIENHLLELKSLFDLVLPGYMPPEKRYREFFLRPIEKEQDPQKREMLTRLIKPFVLRRKKGEVLRDLPEKTEEIFHCGLSNQQQGLYNEVLQRSRHRLLDDLQDPNKAVPYVHIFAVLSQLKQICNHPAAFLKDVHNYQRHHSGKWDLFMELLREARDSGQKVVVFSQYLSMLDLFEAYLTDQGVGYASVRGATVDRASEIRRFNLEPHCEVFLGSLQAVGLGVDLTAGSVVIHYDRWWNAARENQATDRVHRIGQTRGVQVLKLVTKGTFEERIDELIMKKGRLMEDVVSADPEDIVKRLNRHELMELLQEIQENSDTSSSDATESDSGDEDKDEDEG